MKTIYTKEGEYISKKGLGIDTAKKISKKTKSNTYSGYLLSCIKKHRDEGNLDAALLTEVYYKKFMKDFNPKKVNTIELIGWKGKDEPEYYKDFTEDFVIIEHRKDKNGEVEKIQHEVPKENVNYLMNLIKSKLEIGESIKYKQTIMIIIKQKNLPCDRDSFNGGRNRNAFYFPLYQFPARILEKLGYIEYSGRGTIKRIK